MYGLSYLLKILKISPQDLSDYLNVHRTLVSKWKSGARNVDANSKYLNNLIDYIVIRNEELQLNTLENLMLSLYGYNHKKSKNQQQLKKYVKSLLLDDNFINNEKKKFEKYHDSLYVAGVPIFNTENSVKKIMLHILDLAEEQAKPSNITCLCTNSFDQAVSELSFRTQWIDRIIALLNRDYKLTIVFSSYDDNTNIFMRFHKLFLHKNCTIMKYNSYIGDIFNPSIHLVENRAIMLSLQVLNGKTLMHSTALFTDPVSVETYAAICTNIIKKSKLLFVNKKISITSLSKKYTLLFNGNGLESWHDTMYYYGDVPLLYLMSSELYKKILLQSGVSENSVQSELELFIKRKYCVEKVIDTFKNIHFYSLDSFFKLSNELKICIPNHYITTKTNLKLTKEDYKHLLSLLIDALQSKINLEVCLIPSKLFPDVHSFELWCKKNIGLHAYTSQKSNRIITCYDIDFVNQIATSFEQQYLFAPLEYKLKVSVIDKIHTIIDCL